MDYFISDLHLFHDDVIRYENRPFDNVEHMHIEIIKRHNSVVHQHDTVFVMGDVSFGNKEKTESIIKQLNGKLILIKGNHDRNRSNTWFYDVGFNHVSEWPIIYKDFFILSHEPMYVNENMPYVNIHGHLHKTDWVSKRFMNVSMENWNYTPVSFDKVKEYFGIKEED